MKKPPTAWSRFHQTRSQTLELGAALSQEQIDFSAGPGKWSVGEVLDHLIQVDRLFRVELDELRQRWQAKGGGPARLVRTLSESGVTLPLVPDALLPFFDLPAVAAGIFFPRPVRQRIFGSRLVPAKAPKRIQPEARRPADDLRAELADFSEHLSGFFTGDDPVDGSELRYYNPLTGWTDALGILSFVASHERRHQKQIRDVLAAAGFPRSK